MIRELSKRMEILSHHQLISNECIRGIIHTAHYSAKVDIYYKPLTFKSEPPQVASEELWLKDDVDWHFSVEDTRYGEFCWILPNEWAKLHSFYNKPRKTMMNEGCNLLFNNILSLLNKHWAAHKLGLTEWRLEWPQWKHYTAGVEQYRDEFKDNGTLTNWN